MGNPFTRPRTILHVIDNLDIGGAQALLILLARHCAPAFRTVVCSLQPGHALRSRLETAGAEVHVLGRPRPSILNPARLAGYALQNVRDIVALSRRVKAEVIHCHLSDAVFLGAAASYFAGDIGVVITKHTPHTLPERAFPDARNLLRRIILQVVYRRARKIIAVSHETERALRRDFALPPNRVVQIPNGVAIGSSAAPAPEDLRASLGLAEDDVAVLNVGRLVPVKGQSCLLESMSLLADRHPNIKLFIAGDGECRPQLARRINELGLDGRVRLLGDRSDVGSLLAAADIAAFASLSEGTSLAVLESMAAGKPIVATDIDGNRDVLTHMEDSLLVPPGAPRPMADAVALLAEDRQLAHRLASAAWRKADAEFDFDRVAEAYQDIWQA